MTPALLLILLLATPAVADDAKPPATYDALADALGAGADRRVDGVLAAGLPVGPDSKDAPMAVLNGLATACSHDPAPEDGLARALALLKARGFPLDRQDDRGNTLLMSAAQFCGARTVSALLDLGARPDPVNAQHFTPLQMALVSGKWDAAAVLVDHGARLQRAQADQLFMQPPAKPDQQALLRRATR